MTGPGGARPVAGQATGTVRPGRAAIVTAGLMGRAGLTGQTGIQVLAGRAGLAGIVMM